MVQHIHHAVRSATIDVRIPRPLTDDAITFRDVEDTVSKQVVGKEVVYVPLEVDPRLPTFSDFITMPHDGSRRAYQMMTCHVMEMLRETLMTQNGWSDTKQSIHLYPKSNPQRHSVRGNRESRGWSDNFASSIRSKKAKVGKCALLEASKKSSIQIGYAR